MKVSNINSRAYNESKIGVGNNPVVYLLTSLTEERASILHRLLNYYMRFMASVESMDRRVRPHRYARRRLDFQLAAYRLLVFDICFSFVNLIEALPNERFSSSPGRALFFSRNGNQWSTFSHTSGNVKDFSENVRGIH